MITNFKIFEEKRNKIWIVPLKMPDFIIGLKKIGIPEKDINDWMNLYNKGVFTNYGKYPDRKSITIDKDNRVKDSYTWYWYPSTEGNEYIEFGGKLEITPKEIQNYYYEIEFKQNINKYNL